MSKFTRGQLKELVKECLVEILSEGLASPQTKTPQVNTKTSLSERQTSRTLPTRAQSPALNAVTFSAGVPTAPKTAQKNFENAIKQNVSLLTSDPMMSSIFADTAATTLQEQINADVSPGSSISDDMISSPSAGDVTDIFGESAKNWAALAFAESPKK